MFEYQKVRRLSDYQKRGLKCVKIIRGLKFLMVIIVDEKIQSLSDKRIKSLSDERIKLSGDYNYRTLSNYYHLNT